MTSIRWGFLTHLFLLDVLCQGCSFLDTDRLARLALEQPKAGEQHVVTGRDLERFNLDIGEEVVVVVNSLQSDPTALVGVVERQSTRDSTLTLTDVLPNTYPTTLSVAFRNVEYVYENQFAQELRRVDIGVSAVWLLLGLPSFTYFGALVFSGATALVGCDDSDKKAAIVLLGALTGLVCWIVLTALQ